MEQENKKHMVPMKGILCPRVAHVQPYRIYHKLTKPYLLEKKKEKTKSDYAQSKQ